MPKAVRHALSIFLNAISFYLSVQGALADSEFIGSGLAPVMVALESLQYVAFLHVVNVERLVIEHFLGSLYVNIHPPT